MTSLRNCLSFIALLPLSSLPLLTVIVGVPFLLACLLSLALLSLFYWLRRYKLNLAVIYVNGGIAAAILLTMTVLMVIARGNIEGSLMDTAISWILILLPGGFIFYMPPTAEGIKLISLMILILPLWAFFLSVFLSKRTDILKKAVPFLAGILCCLGVIAWQYANRPSVRYAGHGFNYMHGYSSTDFSEYMVYSEPSRLVQLEAPASLLIEKEADMPKLDGAEACYPLYAAAAKAVYQNIADIEKRYLEQDETSRYTNGKIVRFTNTVHAFEGLLHDFNEDGNYDVDLFFGARPSRKQMEMAKTLKIPLTITPIGREAFVFFVEPDNPVTGLSSEEIRKIYHGDITNWSDLGGKKQEIRPFQRPENSGSQAMMEYFMGDVSLKEPLSYEYVNSMFGVLQKVAEYANEGGAMGYSFRYFVEDLNQENNVRLLAVDGVLPTIENIQNGTYPLTVDLCVVSRSEDSRPYVQKMIDFMLSEEGQKMIEKTGYASLRPGGSR